MISRLRPWILYALGCALVLCVHSLTPRSTFAQQPSEAVQPSTSGAHALSSERAGSTSEHMASERASQSVTADGTGVVNLNSATAAELERLPGIGPARAQAILALRAQLTRFSKVEQLLRVKGIGRATFRKLRPLLALEGPTTLTERKTR